MPLTQRITYKTVLRKKNLLQVPKLERWQYKIEPSQILKVTVSLVGSMGVRESFLANMRKDGRICIPQLQLALLKKSEEKLEEYALEVTLEPA